MNIDKIRDLWNKDSVIDPDNLHHESAKIPQLHSKYFEIYNNAVLLREKTRDKLTKLKVDKHYYYSGKADPEVYIDKPFNKKILDKNLLLQQIEADSEVAELSLKLRYYEVMTKYLEDIIKNINNRSFQIKNSIEFLKFQAGYSGA